jgi:hypothetical protein
MTSKRKKIRTQSPFYTAMFSILKIEQHLKDIEGKNRPQEFVFLLESRRLHPNSQGTGVRSFPKQSPGRSF